MKHLTIGSIFDGSGNFPLGASFYGITPLWASEIEPFAIRVTTKRLPGMKHLGDICKLHGGAIPPTDVVSFGSPCVGLSNAGKREGLKNSQSILFYEAMRVIREMREATNGEKPRFIIFENVQGAYNSNRGSDSKAILDAIVQIAEPRAEVPPADKNGWPYADILVGDGWSIAYRLIDAQFFGVAQRRKRVYLVADFKGERAGEILFEREGVSRDFTPSGSPWENIAGNIAGCAGKSSTNYLTGWDSQNRRIFGADGVSPVLDGGDSAGGRNPGGVAAYGISPYGSNSMMSDNPHAGIYEADTSRTLDANGGRPDCHQGGVAVVAVEGHGSRPSHKGRGYSEDGISYTLNTIEKHLVAYDCRNHAASEISATLQAKNNGGQSLNFINPILAYGIDRAAFNQGENAQYKPQFNIEQSATLVAKDPNAVAHTRKGGDYIVRRLTPQECALLQGASADWCAGLETPEPTDADIAYWSEVWETHRRIMGKSQKPKTRAQIIKWLRNPHSDSAEYKLWGNACALPCICFVMAGIREIVKNYV